MIGHDLIEQLGIERAKVIVEGAPDEATLFQLMSEQPSYLQECGGKHWWFNPNDKSWNVDYSDIRTMHSLNDLRTAIAEYEQGSNSSEFKVGDLVCLNVGSRVYKINHIHKKAVWLDSGKPQLDVVNIDDVLRHATPSEIAAGHRIDKKIESDDVKDITNHISPNTRVVDV